MREDQITKANGVMASIRMFGLLGSPICGSLLYSVGGSPAPMLALACVYFLGYVLFTFVMMPRLPSVLNPPAQPDQATIFTLWTVPAAIVAFAQPIIFVRWPAFAHILRALLCVAGAPPVLCGRRIDVQTPLLPNLVQSYATSATLSCAMPRVPGSD